MSTRASAVVGDALARLEAAVDGFSTASLTSATDDSVLDAWRRLENVRRKLDPVEHRIIAEADQRTLPAKYACKNITSLARQLLHLHPSEAAARVTAAQHLGPRRATTGEPLEPTYPTVAAALAEGAISSRHARTLTKTMDGLPDQVRAERGEEVEKVLVDFASDHDPAVLGRYAQAVGYYFDQDGRYRDTEERDRKRRVSLRRRPDGSGRVEGELSAEAAEHLATWFDAHARPVNTKDAPDPRTAGQRRHDALLDLLKLATRAELSSKSGGCSATIVLTMNADAFATGHGIARTGHGYPVPAEIAKTWAGREARIIAVLLSATKGITAYSTTQRLFTEQQRLALIARDGGCSFPGCDALAQFCEADHVTEFSTTGRTCVDDGTLLCGFHHRHAKDHGWACVMRHGRPWWIPPKWLDPDQEPRRNTMHNPGP